MRPFIAAAAACIISASPAGSQGIPAGPVLQPTRTFGVVGEFRSDKGKTADDISGIACSSGIPDAAPYSCLVVNDQDVHAQWAILTGGTLTAGPRLRLLPERVSPAILGTEPTNLACSEGAAKFKDLDGEAVAFAAPYFYVIGSHGCSRGGSKFHASSFVLARVRLDGPGPVAGANAAPQASAPDGSQNVSTTFRLSDVLRRADGMKEHFGQNLNRNGLNVEGLAVMSGTLYAGLRGPSLGGRAFIVSTPVEPLFAPGNAASTAQPQLLSYQLGEGAGIRDLAPLPDGRLLVLAGPAQDQETVSYTLHAVEPRPAGRAEFLASLAPVRMGDGAPGKAEAVLPLGRKEGALRVLVLFDSLPNGGPREYRVPMR